MILIHSCKQVLYVYLISDKIPQHHTKSKSYDENLDDFLLHP